MPINYDITSLEMTKNKHHNNKKKIGFSNFKH